MEILRLFLRRHFAGKPVVASTNVGCFLRLKKYSDVTYLVLTILRVFLLTCSIKCISHNFSPLIVSIHKELSAKILPRGMIWLFPIVCHPLNNMERHARLTVPSVITLAALHLLAAG